jgi:hypothetical protein
VRVVSPRSIDYEDYDEVVVDRIVSGTRVGSPISAPDAAEAVRRMAVAGYDDGQIALRLGFRRRSIIRIRQRLGIAPALPVGGNHLTRVHPTPGRPRELG